jgi:membrane protein
LSLLVDAAARGLDDNCFRLGASFAFYAVFSIFPLLLLSVSVVGFFLGQGPEARAHVLNLIARASSPEVRVMFDETLTSLQAHRTARGVGALIGFVALVVGASAVFSELQTTMNQIWRVKVVSPKGFWLRSLLALRDRALSLAIVGGAALAVFGSLVVSVLGHLAGGGLAEGRIGLAPTHVAAFASVLLSMGLLTLVLAALLRFIPQTQVTWRDVGGGALVTAVLYTVMMRILGWYFAHIGNYAAYGAVGGFLALLMWIYLAGLFLIYGAELAHLYAQRWGSLRH